MVLESSAIRMRPSRAGTCAGNGSFLTLPEVAGQGRMKLIAAVLAAAIFAGGAAATADPTPGPRRGAALRARFDINGDGRLQPAERAAMRAYIYVRLLHRFDANHDGRLAADEVPPRIAMRLRRFDRNGDGWVDPSEILAPPAPQQQDAQP
jgi:hypothetical protein